MSTKEKQIVKVSIPELVKVLKTKKRGTFCYFEIETSPSMNKRNNPFFGEITKVTKGQVYMGGDYKTRVINKTENQDFEPKECSVGVKVDDSCIYYNENHNRYYLQYEWFKEVLPKSEFFRNGNSIDKMVFQDFLKKHTPNPNGVNFQLVNVENIKRIHFDHIEYVVE